MKHQRKKPLCLGLDPGIENTGWAAVQRTATGFRYVDSGVITTVLKTSLGNRLAQHFVRLQEILKTYTPDMVAIESVFCDTHNG